MPLLVAKDVNRAPFTSEYQFGKSVAIQIGEDGAADQADVVQNPTIVGVQLEFAIPGSINARARRFRVTSGNNAPAHEQAQGAVAIKIPEQEWSSAPFGFAHNILDCCACWSV